MGKTFRKKNSHKKKQFEKSIKEIEHVNFTDEDGAINDYYLSNGEIDGDYKVYYPDGEKSELTYQDGIPIGSYIRYYKNKQKKIETPYVSGKIEGLCQEWYESGEIKIEYICIDDVKDGYYKEYYENGQLKLSSNFKDDKEEGIEIEYNADGSVKNQIYYHDGEEIKDKEEIKQYILKMNKEDE